MEGDTVYDEHIAILKSKIPPAAFKIVIDAWKDKTRATITKCRDKIVELGDNYRRIGIQHSLANFEKFLTYLNQYDNQK